MKGAARRKMPPRNFADCAGSAEETRTFAERRAGILRKGWPLRSYPADITTHHETGIRDERARCRSSTGFVAPIERDGTRHNARGGEYCVTSKREGAADKMSAPCETVEVMRERASNAHGDIVKR